MSNGTTGPTGTTGATGPIGPTGPLDYNGTASLMTDMTFRGRVKVACLHYASYIVDEDPATTAHNTRYRWAQDCLVAPDNAAANITPVVVGDPNVQAAGSSISDADLQTATESAINKVM